MRRSFPVVAILYVLVYWGRTGFGLALAGSFICEFAGARTAATGLLSLALVFCAFTLGLTVGIDGPPPGRRR